MKYFDEFITEDEIDEIVKCDNLYSVDVISLYDKKNRKLLASSAKNDYLCSTQGKGLRLPIACCSTCGMHVSFA